MNPQLIESFASASAFWDDTSHERPERREMTKVAILKQAIPIACQLGLDELSFGVLAAQTGMSKGGVYGRFGSTQALHLAVIAYCSRQFEEAVIRPGKKPGE
jgi:AcrR family transcriptional regulator